MHHVIWSDYNHTLVPNTQYPYFLGRIPILIPNTQSLYPKFLGIKIINLLINY